MVFCIDFHGKEYYRPAGLSLRAPSGPPPASGGPQVRMGCGFASWRSFVAWLLRDGFQWFPPIET